MDPVPAIVVKKSPRPVLESGGESSQPQVFRVGASPRLADQALATWPDVSLGPCIPLPHDGFWDPEGPYLHYGCNPERATKISLIGSEKRGLKRLVAAHTTEQRLSLRARIILMAYQGHSNSAIAKSLGIQVKTVRKWRDRFAIYRMDGLFDKDRCGRPDLFEARQRHEVFALVVTPPPEPYAVWTLDLLAEELMNRGVVTSISRETISYWLRTADIKPHLSKYWLNSKDPQFKEKKKRVINFYINPPTDGKVLCVDEKTGMQALERCHPDLPPGPGRVRRREFEYKRHGTVSLLAAFDVKSGKVTGQFIDKNDSANFISFLKMLMKLHPGVKLYLILDNGSSHTSQETTAFFEQHSDQLVPVFLPTHTSWLNQIEVWFSALSRKALRKVSFASRSALRLRIQNYISIHNRTAKPYRWTAKGRPLKGVSTPKLQRGTRGKAFARFENRPSEAM
jgi:transposase